MQHRLLILGSLGEFISLTKKSKERGYYTIVCDGYPDGPARAFADENYVIAVTNIQAIADLCKEKKVDGIITSFSDLLLECMVKIADRAGLPCYLKPDQLDWYRDKSATRALLSKLGLPSPKHTLYPAMNESVEVHSESKQTDDKQTDAKFSDMHFPMVTKPLDKYGSRGIYVIHNEEELKKFAPKAAAFSDRKQILLEEYNDGFEFNMMTWVLEGKVHVISIADREKTAVDPNSIPISTRNIYPSRLYDRVADDATALLQSYIEKTGQMDGALSMQFFWKPEEGIQVCEIAARFFGYEHELTDTVFGFNMEELLLNSVYDRPALQRMLIRHDPQKPLCHGAVIYFQGRELTIKDQSVPRALAEHPAVDKPWIFYKDGETVEEHGPNPYVALYYVHEESRKKLDEVTEEFYRRMTIPSIDGQEVVYSNQIPAYPE